MVHESFSMNMVDASETEKKEAPALRSDVHLLSQALADMEASLRDNMDGHNPDDVAMGAAREADVHRVMEILEPKIYSVDVILNELVKQLSVQCAERGELLEACRTHILAMMSISATAMGALSSLCETLQTECDDLRSKLRPLGTEHQESIQRISSLELQLEEAHNMIETRDAELDEMKLGLQKTQQVEDRSRGAREKSLQQKIEQLNEMNSLVNSRMSLLINQLGRAESKSGYLQALVQELQERVRRDTTSTDFLKVENARLKIALWWLRCLVHVKRNKMDLCKSAATQDGSGLRHALTLAGHAESSDMDDSNEDSQAVDDEDSGFKASGNVGKVAFSVFWQGIIRQSEFLDLEARNVEFWLELPKLLEKISMLYTEKIIVDELDDKLNMTRRLLPEFTYEYHLEKLFDPVLAEEAIVNLIANVRYHQWASPRVRMFGRLLNLENENISQDSLNMFLLGLVKVQGGASPLLPNFDGVQIEEKRAQHAIEHVFAQVMHKYMLVSN